MRIVIRPADLDQDRDLLVKTLSLYLTPTSSLNRFNWLYRQNPHGLTRAWVAFDSDNGELVGSSAAFARRFMVKGTERAGWVLGDFCIADKYRSLGPALQLQRATLQSIQDMSAEGFCYDFPSRRLAATYHRLGIHPADQMVRLVKLLRVDRKMEQLCRSKTLAKAGALMGNMLLHLSGVNLRSGKDWDLGIHSGDCGEEFSALEKTLPGPDGIEVRRCAEYLNWRYRRHPLFHYDILTARKSGELKGYLIFNCPDEHVQIAEWRVGNDYNLLAALFGRLVQMLRKTRAITLNAYLLGSDSRLLHLKKLGFWPRESNPLMVYGPGCQGLLSCNWHLMYGDRDS